MTPETSTSVSETEEVLKSTENDFLGLLSETGFPSGLVDTLRGAILTNLELKNIDQGACFFQDVGYVENGTSDGRYRMILSNEIIDSRAKRLEGLTVPGDERRIALVWVIAHELGHGLEAAYTIDNTELTTEGTFAGLPFHHYPTNEFLAKFPELKAAPHIIDADRIERERWAEGFAQEMLVRELMKSGLDNHEVIRSVQQLYEPMKKRVEILSPLLDQTSETVALADVYDGRLDETLGQPLDPQFVKHQFGYANPMPVSEIANRYRQVTPQ